MGGEGERGGDAEVAPAAAAAGPEQVRVAVRVAGPDLAVGGDDLRLHQVVAGQPVGAGDHADAAAQGQPGDADGRAGAAGDGPVVGGQPVVEIDQPGARGHGGGPGSGVDLDRGHRGHVHDQAGGGRPARVAVAAAAGRDRHAVVAGEGQAGGDVVGRVAVGDAGRAEAVEAGVEQPQVIEVAGRSRPDQRAGQVRGQRGPVRGRGRRGGAGAGGRGGGGVPGPAGRPGAGRQRDRRQGGQPGHGPGAAQERPAPWCARARIGHGDCPPSAGTALACG